MNKAQLVEKLASRTGTTKLQSEEMLDMALDIISNSVSRGEEVKLVGFGTFVRTKRAARKARNPKTGETYAVPATYAPRFRVGKDFKTKVNK